MATIQTDIRDHVLVITLNRPEARNAFNKPMADAMQAIIDQYEADDGLRVAVLRTEEARAAFRIQRFGTKRADGQMVRLVFHHQPHACRGSTGCQRTIHFVRCLNQGIFTEE